MPIPDYQSLMRPLLAFASNGSEKNINDARYCKPVRSY
jgi:restriction system protein